MIATVELEFWTKFNSW